MLDKWPYSIDFLDPVVVPSEHLAGKTHWTPEQDSQSSRRTCVRSQEARADPEDGHSASYALVPWKEEVEEYACNLRNIQMGSLNFEWTEHLEKKNYCKF